MLRLAKPQRIPFPMILSLPPSVAVSRPSSSRSPAKMLSPVPVLRHRRRLLIPLLLAASALLLSPLSSAHADPSCPFSSSEHHHHHDGDHHRHHHPDPSPSGGFSAADHHHHDDVRRSMLPEELAEEEDLELFGFDFHHHDHDHDHDDDYPGHDLSPLGLWVQAMGCSFLVSMASLICLTILPLIFLNGKPSKTVVDALAVFGAGAMLGDAFLHQLPHAFGGGHSHSHEHHTINMHDHHHEHGHAHAHSLEGLSVGLSILSGIILFLLVEKVVRYVEEHSGSSGHHHHHHHHHHHKLDEKFKSDDGTDDTANAELVSSKETDGESDVYLKDEKVNESENHLRKRASSSGASTDAVEEINHDEDDSKKKTSSSSSLQSGLVFGYLNLFSDGVHNFTDGMALGSAFLLHGSVGGWSRTLFLLAHELPQEVGDFGILVRSGFTVSEALFFNFLSALVALAGTALALILGKDPGQSSLIEGFTAGGFIYIAVAGVLPVMNSEKTTLKSTAVQLSSLTLGMGVALWISLVE